MRRELLHTPEGVRDIYNGECDKKQRIEQELHQTFLSFGYHTIQTPTFEFFDVFNREIGTIPSKDLYKFFDREGNTLVLRPDMTPSIARAYQCILARKLCRSDSAMPEIFLSITTVIRAD